MPKNKPPTIQSPLPRSARWHYWVFVPLCALAYTVFCIAVALLGWGMDGESQPWWYVIAFVLAIPGMSSLPGMPPFILAPLWGGVMGFGLIRLTRRIRSRRLPIPPRR